MLFEVMSSESRHELHQRLSVCTTLGQRRLAGVCAVSDLGGGVNHVSTSGLGQQQGEARSDQIQPCEDSEGKDLLHISLKQKTLHN